MLGDGISTTLSALFGSVPTTTYGENIGVMAVTKVYSVRVIGGAALFSILLAFIGKASALIQTIPAPVMGGISFLLYGMIAASGLRLLVDQKVDYSKGRNLALSAVSCPQGFPAPIQIRRSQAHGHVPCRHCGYRFKPYLLHYRQSRPFQRLSKCDQKVVRPF